MHKFVSLCCTAERVESLKFGGATLYRYAEFGTAISTQNIYLVVDLFGFLLKSPFTVYMSLKMTEQGAEEWIVAVKMINCNGENYITFPVPSEFVIDK